MATINYESLAKDVIAAIGGAENISSVSHCATRLRFVLKDEGAANRSAVEAVPGVKGVVQSGGQYQIVIGSKVSLAYSAICALPGIDAGSAEASEGKEEEKPKGILNTLLQTVSGIFTPLLLVMCGSGVVKGILAICTTTGILTETSGTYIVLFAAADAIFRYMPLALAFSAAKKFGANQFVALAVVAAMCYPSIVGLAEGTTFFGISLTAMDYHSSVLPALIVVYVLSKLEGLLKKVVPEFLFSFVMPCVCLIVVVPVSLLVIGPVLTIVANGLAAGYSAIASISPILPGIVIGGFWNLLVVFGVHWTFIPLMINNVSVYGFDTMICLVGPSNFGQAGAALGVFLKTKKNNVKSVAGSAALSGLFGITEPAIYGVNLRYKTPLIGGLIAGAVGGVITAMAGAQTASVVIPGLLTLPAFMPYPGFVGLLIGCIVAYVGSAAIAFVTYNDGMEQGA